MEYINKIIEESDYYIVILKGKYGSTGSDGISYTEKEFNYATSIGIPCLAFIYRDFNLLQRTELDDDINKQKKFLRFKKRLEKDRLVSYWSDDFDLVSCVKDSIQNIVRTKPGIGYVRGDEVIDVKIANERERLLEENLRLKSALEKAHTDNYINLIPNKKLKDISATTKLDLYINIESETDNQTDNLPSVEEFTINITWHNILLACSRIFEKTQIETEIIYLLTGYFRIPADIKRNPRGKMRFVDPEKAARKIRVQLEALGFIRSIIEEAKDTSTPFSETRFDNNYFINVGQKRKFNVIRWELTQRGKHYVSYYLAEKENVDE